MKKILFILLAITGCVFTSCENQDWEFPDFEYTTVYFAYQTPVRTITFGEDVWDTSLDNQGQCQIMATIGGVYSNDKDRTISFQVDNSIVDDITFADGSEIKAMPSNYYTLSDNNKIVIPKGKLLGGVTVQLTDAFFADPEAASGKYVIPVRMTDVQGADSILAGVPLVENPRLAVAGDWDVQPKNYILYAVKYISQYDSWYLRAGTDVYSDARGTVNRQPASGYIEHAQQVKSFSTLDKNSILWDFEVSDATGYARNAQLQLDFADNGAVTLTSLGTGNAATATSSGIWTNSAASVDLNNLENKHGWANGSGSASNLPSSASAGTVVSFNNSSSKLQLFAGYKTTHDLYYRKWYNSSWEAWRTILDSSNYTSYAIPTGGGVAIGSSSARYTNGYFSGSVYAASGFYESSDERLKDFKDPLSIDLDKLKSLRKSYFTFKDDLTKSHIGVSAQEIQTVFPEIVSETDGYLNVDYSKLSVIALAAIDTINDNYKELEKRLEKLESLLNQ